MPPVSMVGSWPVRKPGAISASVALQQQGLLPPKSRQTSLFRPHTSRELWVSLPKGMGLGKLALPIITHVMAWKRGGSLNPFPS